MSDQLASQQIEVADRFVKRLIALVDAGVIYPPSQQAAGYKDAVLHIGARVEADSSRRLEEFAVKADRELRRAGLRGELLEAASSAVRSVLVRAAPDTEPSARLVYQPFEHKIPYHSLL